MKELKIAKYQVLGSLNSITIFYLIYVSVIILLCISAVSSGGNVHSSGLDFSTMIFLLVSGLNSFKSNFMLVQANNISRKTFIKGLIIGVFPITFVMAIIDLIINRVQNIFARCPSTFDMIYGNYRMIGNSGSNWIQSNDLQTLIGSVIWQFAIYSAIFIMGILITLCYYRSNKILKIVISVVPAVLLAFTCNTNNTISDESSINIAGIIAGAFGWQSKNPYIAVFSLTVLILIFSMIIYLLVRKAVLKQ